MQLPRRPLIATVILVLALFIYMRSTGQGCTEHDGEAGLMRARYETLDVDHVDFSLAPASSKRRPTYSLYSPTSLTSKPLVSVVIPFCNGGSDLYDTVKSVFRQSLQQFEIIVINDASRRESARLLTCLRNGALDPRVRVMDLNNTLGLAAARNTGFEHAQADLVFTLDVGDQIEPTTLEMSMWHMHSYSDAAFVKGKSIGYGVSNYTWQKSFDDTDFLNTSPLTSSCMIRRSAWIRVGGYDTSVRDGDEHTDFLLRAARCGVWGSSIPHYTDWFQSKSPYKATSDWPSLIDPIDLKTKYNDVYKAGLPKLNRVQSFASADEVNSWKLDSSLSGLNTLTATTAAHRILIITSCAKEMHGNMLTSLSHGHNASLSVIVVDEGSDCLLTSGIVDSFALKAFIREHEYLSFVDYFIKSRQIDHVFIHESTWGEAAADAIMHLNPDLNVLALNGLIDGVDNETYLVSISPIGVNKSIACDTALNPKIASASSPGKDVIIDLLSLLLSLMFRLGGHRHRHQQP